MAIARRAAEAGVVLTALIVAIGAGWWLTSRARDDDGQAAPLPTPLPHSFRYFSPVPTPAPTRVGLSRRFTPAGLEGGLPHEVLAALPDPNTTDPRYAITALDAVTDSVGGPRLALAGGATNGTIDLGEVVAGQPVTVPLVLANAGDAPLHLAQIHTPSAAVVLDVPGSPQDAAGRLRGGVAIPAGDQQAVTLRFDPDFVRAPGETGPVDIGAQALYVQLFSDDRSAPRMDDGDPDSGERRLRIVFVLRSPDAPGRPVADAERPIPPNVPRIWLDEGARWGRGGRVVDLGPIDGAAPGTAFATIRNLGAVPLTLAVEGPAAGTATLEGGVVPPGGSMRLAVVLPPVREDDALAAHGAYRHSVTLATNDPLVPTLDVAFIGRTARRVSPGGP